ncbi:MAG: retroviral-like aspartic protease family protein [Candidatus Bathyarchaeia archaeon]
MGHAYVKIRIYNLPLSKYEDVELLVDTGSTYTWVPTEVLNRLGIKREDSRNFRTIEGKVIERSVGMGFVECMDRRAPTVLVFAEEGDARVLGVHALEGLGLEVDPTTKELRKVRAVLAI